MYKSKINLFSFRSILFVKSFFIKTTINLAKLKEDDLNKKTALVKHCFNCEHRIDFGNFEILDYNIDYDKRKFLESLYINNTKNSINDKDRNVFPKIYSNIKNLN